MRRPWVVVLLGAMVACSGQVQAVADRDAGDTADAADDSARIPVRVDAGTDAPPDAVEDDHAAPDACAPATCASLGLECGAAFDGCGTVLSCGACPAPLVCGGGGVAGVCGGLAVDAGDAGGPCSGGSGCCILTCQRAGYQCGVAGDGCGGILDCGACANGLRCELNVCVHP